MSSFICVLPSFLPSLPSRCLSLSFTRLSSNSPQPPPSHTQASRVPLRFSLTVVQRIRLNRTEHIDTGTTQAPGPDCLQAASLSASAPDDCRITLAWCDTDNSRHRKSKVEGKQGNLQVDRLGKNIKERIKQKPPSRCHVSTSPAPGDACQRRSFKTPFGYHATGKHHPLLKGAASHMAAGCLAAGTSRTERQRERKTDRERDGGARGKQKGKPDAFNI